MKPNLRQLLTVMCVLGTLALMARDPVACKPNYYNNALNKKGQALLTALYNIVSSHTDVGYDGLWNVYDDADTNSGGYYIDLYSNYDKFTRAKKCGNYSNIGDCVNREHSFPKSWWGSGKADQYSDAYHLYPTDGYVNNQRSNYPFGECANGTRLTNGKYYGKGKLGTSTFSGYSGIVFEPDDEYKGDFARTYFYMATAYNNIFGKWHGDMLASSFPYFSDWALNLLLKWHRQDPVSDKERLRNNYVCAWQENRNPYIDHPELVEHIWGNQADKNWTGSDMSTPTITAPAQGDVLDLGTVRIGNTLTATLTVKGNALEEELEIIVTGTGFSASPTIIDVDDALAGTTVTVSFVSNTQGTFTGNLQVTSSETTAVNVALRAQAVDGIVAKPATSITSTGFTANWENTDQSTGNYNLFVTDAQGTVLEGYPVAVRASLLSKAVTGLQPLTAYRYYLESATDATFKSNVVEVTTLPLEKILSIEGPDDGFDLTAVMGSASPIVEGIVYAENITEDITLEVDGNFVLSQDRVNWSNSLTLDSDGEAFYLKMANTGTMGEYTATLEASTVSGVSAEILVNGHVKSAAQTETLVETWEGCTTGGYWNKDVQGAAFLWNFNNAGIWSDDNSRDDRSCRLGNNTNSCITLLEDVDGISEVTFYAAKWGSDASATLLLEYSTDKGNTCNTLKTYSITESSLSQFTAEANVTGDARIRLRQTAGKRLNIDDIAITNNPPTAPVILKGDVNADDEISIADVTALINIILSETQPTGELLYRADVNDDSEVGIADITALINIVLTQDDNGAPRWDAFATGATLTACAAHGNVVEVYDMDGQLVAQGALISRSLPRGTYVVVCNNQSKKIIIK